MTQQNVASERKVNDGVRLLGALVALITGLFLVENHINQSISAVVTPIKAELKIRRAEATSQKELQTKFLEMEARLDTLRKVAAVHQKYIDKHIASAEAWQDNHDLRVRGLNAAQWERIRALERSEYGQAETIEQGVAVGAGR